MQEAFANERQERRKQMTISRDTWRNSHMFERDITPVGSCSMAAKGVQYI